MFEDLELAEKSRGQVRNGGIDIGGSVCLLIKVSNRRRIRPASPSPHLRADHSTQEDAEDAEKRDLVSFAEIG